jgi:hypothetical protein
MRKRTTLKTQLMTNQDSESGDESSVDEEEGNSSADEDDDDEEEDSDDDYVEDPASLKFETVTIMGIQGVDYNLPTPMVEDMAQYYVKHNVWCLFQGECNENNCLCSYPELIGISIKDNSYIIPSIEDLIHIGKFIAVAAAIRYDRSNVLKTRDDLPDTSIHYAHPLSKECHERLG